MRSAHRLVACRQRPRRHALAGAAPPATPQTRSAAERERRLNRTRTARFRLPETRWTRSSLGARPLPSAGPNLWTRDSPRYASPAARSERCSLTTAPAARRYGLTHGSPSGRSGHGRGPSNDKRHAVEPAGLSPFQPREARKPPAEFLLPISDNSERA